MGFSIRAYRREIHRPYKGAVDARSVSTSAPGCGIWARTARTNWQNFRRIGSGARVRRWPMTSNRCMSTPNEDRSPTRLPIRIRTRGSSSYQLIVGDWTRWTGPEEDEHAHAEGRPRLDDERHRQGSGGVTEPVHRRRSQHLERSVEAAVEAKDDAEDGTDDHAEEHDGEEIHGAKQRASGTPWSIRIASSIGSVTKMGMESNHTGVGNRRAEIRIVERAQVVRRADEFSWVRRGGARQRDGEAPEQREDPEDQDQQDRRQQDMER